MWTNLIDKLQQKLDDAADLLGDEESNEGENSPKDGIIAPNASTAPDVAADEKKCDVKEDAIREREAHGTVTVLHEAEHAVPCEAAAVVVTSSGDTVADEGESQLLRFQRQLAEEMQHVTALSEENAALKDKLAANQRELRDVQNKLATSAAATQDVSVLIDKLGKEKERTKVLLRERDAARERVTVLEGVVEEYEAKETQWRVSNETQTRNDDAVHARIAELERLIAARETQHTKLHLRLDELQRAKDVLEVTLRDERESHAQALTQARSSNSDATRYLNEELERVRAAAQNTIAEGEQRIAMLEEALEEASSAVHFAEMRVAEGEARSASVLQELRGELSEYMSLAGQRGNELATVRAECDALRTQQAAWQKERALLERTCEEQIATHRQARVDAEAALRQAQEECHTLQQRLQRALDEAEHTAETRTTAHGSPPFTSAVLEDALTPPHRVTSSDSLISSPPLPTRQAILEATRPESSKPSVVEFVEKPSLHLWQTTSLALLGAPNTERVPSLATSPAPPMFGHVTSDLQSRRRLERELVHQSVELERLRGVEAAAASTRRELDELRRRHDLLMQLYGQLAESINPPLSSSTRDQ